MGERKGGREGGRKGEMEGGRVLRKGGGGGESERECEQVESPAIETDSRTKTIIKKMCTAYLRTFRLCLVQVSNLVWYDRQGLNLINNCW